MQVYNLCSGMLCLVRAAADGQAAKQAAVAFKCKAGRWMLLERKAAQLAYNSTLLNVIYLGIIWEYTGDLATPATAALLAAAAECCFVQRELQQRSN